MGLGPLSRTSRSDTWRHKLRLGLGRSQESRSPHTPQATPSGSRMLQNHAGQAAPEVSVPGRGQAAEKKARGL